MGNSLSQYPVGQLGLLSPRQLLEGTLEGCSVSRDEAAGTTSKLLSLGQESVDKYLGKLVKELKASKAVTTQTIRITIQIPCFVTPVFEVPVYSGLGHPVVQMPSSASPTAPTPIPAPTPAQALGPVLMPATPPQLPQKKRPPMAAPDNVLYAVTLLGWVLMHNYSLIECMKLLLNPERVSAAAKTALAMETKLDSKTLEEIRNLKRSLILYNIMLEKVIDHYTLQPGAETKELPRITDITRRKLEIEGLLHQLTYKNVHRLLPQINFFPEHVLCAVLGVRPECAEWMRSRPDDVRYHQSDEYWIHQFLENQHVREELSDASIGDAYANITPAALAEKYEALGFTDSRAHELVQRLSGIEHRDHQNLIYWANKHVENSFVTDILLADSPRYPYGCDKVDCWQEEPIPADDKTGDDELEGTWPVRYYNVDKTPPEKLRAQHEKSKHSPTDPDEYWYHGTQHYCAQHIIENGVDVEKGCEQQDFSDGKGFYVFPDFPAAERWAKATGDRAAVVVFKVPKSIFHDFPPLDLSRDEGKYKKIVEYCRSGKKSGSLTRLEARELEKRDCVKGPRLLRLGQGSSQSNGQQLCIRSWDLADVFGDIRNVDSVYFY